MGHFLRRLHEAWKLVQVQRGRSALFVSCLLLSSRSLLLPSATVQTWTPCFYCSSYYQITAYAPLFSFSFNIKVSANLGLGFVPSVSFWIASFYHFSLCLLPSVQEPSVWWPLSCWIEDLIVLSIHRGQRSPGLLPGHPMSLGWTVLVALVRCSSLVHLIPSKVLGLQGSEHRDRYVRNPSEVGCGHGSRFEGSQLEAM